MAAGYLDDPFATLLHSNSQSPRRLPLMNRGTYVRTTAIDRTVDTFLASHEGKQVQIISLGAGSDTRYFRLHRKYHDRPLDLLYHEFDLAENVQTKISYIQRPEFLKVVNEETRLDWPNPLPATTTQASPHFTQGPYTLSSLDLRTLSSSSPSSSINANIPTLIISECCLCYLPPALATNAIQHFTSTLFPPSTPLSIVIYEPTRPNDAFGRTMTSNLASRGLSLPTLQQWPDPQGQITRLREAGFSTQSPPGSHEGGAPEDTNSSAGSAGGEAKAADLDFIWRKWIGEEEKERVEALEWMDEVEEFVLLGKHYVVAWGWRGYATGEDGGWRALPSE